MRRQHSGVHPVAATMHTFARVHRMRLAALVVFTAYKHRNGRKCFVLHSAQTVEALNAEIPVSGLRALVQQETIGAADFWTRIT